MKAITLEFPLLKHRFSLQNYLTKYKISFEVTLFLLMSQKKSIFASNTHMIEEE